MRARWTTACLAGLVLGAACSGSAGTATSSGGSGSSTAPSAQAPVTTTSTTTPAPLSHEQAAERYLAIVEPYNIALEALEQAVNGGQEVGALQAQAAAVATANATQIAELQATVWPADVQPAVDELVAESDTAQTYWLQASQAQTRDAVIAAAVSAGEHDGGAAVDTIRSLLGLGGYDEDDYS
jgi:hypothetical protein